MMKPKMGDWCRILAVGDVIGRPGRRFLARALPILKAAYHYDFCVVNVENAAGGFGITPEVYREILGMGVDCMTSGNHIFDKRGTTEWIPEAELLLRPDNFPRGTPGRGAMVVEASNGSKIGLFNLMGRTFMKPYDCPFRAADRLVDHLRGETPLVLLDFHGEATSEKMAMGWHLAGRASAVWGTHTHVPTADGRVLDLFTGYQTDLGMTGPYDSVIGMRRESVLEGFITLGRTRFEVAKGDPRLGASLFDLDTSTGACMQWRGLFLDAKDLERIEQGQSAASHR